MKKEISWYLFTCIIVKPLNSGENGCFSSKSQGKNAGFQEKSQGKFVLFRQKSGNLFQKVCINPVTLKHSLNETSHKLVLKNKNFLIL